MMLFSRNSHVAVNWCCKPLLVFLEVLHVSEKVWLSKINSMPPKKALWCSTGFTYRIQSYISMVQKGKFVLKVDLDMESYLLYDCTVCIPSTLKNLRAKASFCLSELFVVLSNSRLKNIFCLNIQETQSRHSASVVKSKFSVPCRRNYTTINSLCPCCRLKICLPFPPPSPPAAVFDFLSSTFTSFALVIVCHSCFSLLLIYSHFQNY